MNTNPYFPWIATAVVISTTWAFVSNVEAAKPVDAEPGAVILEGSVTADDGSGGAVGTFDIEVKSGKETIVTIVVRHFWFDAVFAKSVDFYGNKYDEYGDPDGATCFGDPVMVSGAYRLYEDRTAEFSTYPEFLTADGEEIQKYVFFLTGEHDVASLENFPVTGPADVGLTFKHVEISTEGKGQNRRRSCIGEFDFDNDGFSAMAKFTREESGP